MTGTMKYSELIEKYIAHKMTAEERQAFEEKVRNTPELQQELKDAKEVIELVESYAFSAKKKHLNDLISQRNTSGRNFKWLWLVLGVLLLGVAVWFWNSTKEIKPERNSKVLYATYFEDYTMSGVKRGSGDVDLADIQKLYVYKEYQSTLERISMVETPTTNLLMVKATCEMQLKNWESALQTLEEAKLIDDPLYTYTILYYEGLVYLQLDNKTKAIEIFNTIASTSSSYATEALEILSELKK